MANVNFRKGLRAGLPATYAEGTFYVTTDERAIYLDISNEARIRLGDFQEFATIDALTANTNPSTTALYYVSDINCLAKWNGSEYVQINKDTGMTSVEVVGEGNAVTAAVYSADGRKLTLTKGATYMTAADVDDKISAADTELRAYVDEKTKGIATDAALGELQDRVAATESDIEALQAATGENGSVTTSIAAAQAKADEAAEAAEAAQATADSKTTMAEVEAKDYATKAEAQGYANAKDEAIAAAQAKADEAYTLAGTKATMDQVNAAIAGAGHAVKSEVDKSISDLDAAYKAADSALETKLQGNIDKKVEQSAYDAKVAELAGADATLQGNIDAAVEALEGADEAQVARIEALEGTITGLSGAMHFKGVETALPEGDALANYADGDVIVVGEKEYVFNNGTFVEFGDVSAEGDRISELETAMGEAEGAIADNTAAIEGEAKRAGEAEAALSGRIDALETIDHDHDNKDVLDGITAEKVADWDGAQAAAEATASAALSAAKTELEGKINAASGAASAAQSKADEAYALAGTKATMTEVEAKGYATETKAGELASAAQTAAESHADGLNTAMNTRVAALEAIDHDAYKGYADQAEADAVTTANAYADGLSKNYDAVGSAATAETNAKAYADSLVMTWGSF